MMPTTIASELSKHLKIEYLETLPSSELAFWLINSFSPERYRDSNDIVKLACRLMFKKCSQPLIANEFIERLWGMHGQLPDRDNVIYLKRNENV